MGKIPHEIKMYGVSSPQKALLEMRRIFGESYCRLKGWDIDNLSIEQIMKIREQDGWKNPKGD